MKIEITMPEPYKNFIIVGVAIEAPRLKRWKSKGIVYSKSGKELKQLEPKQGSVPDKETAHYYALNGCRYWIDVYGPELGRIAETGVESELGKKACLILAAAHGKLHEGQKATPVWRTFRCTTVVPTVELRTLSMF